jgi:hypothetical protein
MYANELSNIWMHSFQSCTYVTKTRCKCIYNVILVEKVVITIFKFAIGQCMQMIVDLYKVEVSTTQQMVS